MQPSHRTEDVRGLDGPDYLALVIEWDDDIATIVRSPAPNRAPAASHKSHKIATVLGVLSALAFATWGIHHLRAAS